MSLARQLSLGIVGVLASVMVLGGATMPKESDRTRAGLIEVVGSGSVEENPIT
ncbi:MAG TPA: hypothetical protein VJR03_07215 [Nitrospira sp.]|nr:hypothetical protein [Nitrospira sp.]